MGVFHLMFSVSLQCSGSPIKLVSPGIETWPSPQGPRNSGQSARAAARPVANITGIQVEKLRAIVAGRHLNKDPFRSPIEFRECRAEHLEHQIRVHLRN